MPTNNPKEEKKEEKKPKEKNKSEQLHSVKGMRDLLDTNYFRYQGFFEKASEIALYYGFNPIETPVLEKEELFTSGLGETTDVIQKEMYSLKTKGGDHLALRPEGTAPIMRSYLEHGMQSLPQPVLLPDEYHVPEPRQQAPEPARCTRITRPHLAALHPVLYPLPTLSSGRDG
jgi:histidyl-tRNA synthetase